jgi:REP element-mobilizing transposase RayT
MKATRSAVGSQVAKRGAQKRGAQKRGALPFTKVGFKTWGGARKGAGRKPKGEKAGVSHGVRAALASRYPAHVTVVLKKGLPRLRRAREYAVLRRAFAAGCERFGMRLVHYAVLNDHLHLLVEAGGREALVRGMQGLLIRVAKALNKLWGRKGSVFGDRYHDRVLKTPKEVRLAIRYVLTNGFKHHRQGASARVPHASDLYTSGPWFDGWRETINVLGLDVALRPVAGARRWLLGTGWRRGGLLSVYERAAG